MLTVAANEEMKMSSLDISELVGSRHDKVKQSIERLAKSGVIQSPPMGEIENKQSLGPRKYASAYIFEGEQGKRDSIVVVAQLSPEFTARLVDRWQELEEKQSPKVPQSYPEALRLAAELAEKNIQLSDRLAIAAPKADFYDRYADASGTFGFRQVCKALGEKESVVRSVLVEKGVMYRLGGHLTPYQNHIDAGRFTVKTGEASNGHAFTQGRFTTKGVVYVAGLIADCKLKATS